MVINIQKEGSETKILFLQNDRIDTTNLKMIKEQLNTIISLINESSRQSLVFDFQPINFIDSSGLSMFINIYKSLKEHDNELSIVNTNDFIKNLFSITKLDTFIQINND